MADVFGLVTSKPTRMINQELPMAQDINRSLNLSSRETLNFWLPEVNLNQLSTGEGLLGIRNLGEFRIENIKSQLNLFLRLS